MKQPSRRLLLVLLVLVTIGMSFGLLQAGKAMMLDALKTPGTPISGLSRMLLLLSSDPRIEPDLVLRIEVEKGATGRGAIYELKMRGKPGLDALVARIDSLLAEREGSGGDRELKKDIDLRLCRLISSLTWIASDNIEEPALPLFAGGEDQKRQVIEAYRVLCVQLRSEGRLSE